MIASNLNKKIKSLVHSPKEKIAIGGKFLEICMEENKELCKKMPFVFLILMMCATQAHALDFGEAPSLIPANGSTNSYKTKLSEDGARHTTVAGIQLGKLLNQEADATPVAFGSLINSPDNDGVIFNPSSGISNLITKNPFISTSNTVVVNASVGGYLNAWIDFNQNGLFEPSEQIFADQKVLAGNNTLSFDVPSATYAGLTYARFRFTTQAGTATSPTGLAPDGEVEDYSVKVTSPVTPSSCLVNAPVSYGLDLRWYDTATATLTSRLFQRVGALKDGTLIDLLLTTNKAVNSFNGTLPLPSGQSISFPARTTYSFKAQFYVSGTNTPISLSTVNLLTDIDGTSSTIGTPSPVGDTNAEHVAWNKTQVFDAQYDSTVQLYQVASPFTGVADAASAAGYTHMAVGKYGNAVEITYPSETAKAVRLINNVTNSVDWMYYSGQFGGLSIKFDGSTDIGLTCPDVTLSKTGTAIARAGDPINYQLKISNASNSLASNTTITDTIPANTTFVSASNGGSYNATTRTVTWNLGTIIAGGTQTVSLVLTAPNANIVMSGTSSVVNTASANATNDTNPSNNSSSATTNLYHFTLTKSVRNVTRNSAASTTSNGLPNDVLEYCITANNYGSVPLANLVISDDIPANIIAKVAGGNSTGGYDTDANAAGYVGSGYGIKLTTGNVVSYLTSAADADAGRLDTTAGANNTGFFRANISTIAAGTSVTACFRGSIK